MFVVDFVVVMETVVVNNSGVSGSVASSLVVMLGDCVELVISSLVLVGVEGVTEVVG